MTTYDNSNSGSIWKNDKKKTDKHPDFTGSLDVEGVEFWVSGWLRAKDANPKAPAMKFKISKKESKSDSQSSSAPASDSGIDIEGDIPF